MNLPSAEEYVEIIEKKEDSLNIIINTEKIKFKIQKNNFFY